MPPLVDEDLTPSLLSSMQDLGNALAELGLDAERLAALEVRVDGGNLLKGLERRRAELGGHEEAVGAPREVACPWWRESGAGRRAVRLGEQVLIELWLEGLRALSATLGHPAPKRAR